MKKVILILSLMPSLAFGQVNENFEPGNLINWVQSVSGRWKADTLSKLSGSYSLHHLYDNPDQGIDRIGLELKNFHPAAATTRWSFMIRHGYDPSSSNNWSVFLMSDAGPGLMSLASATKGYAIGVNMTGSDDSLRLVKVNNGIITTVVNCHVNWQVSAGTVAPVTLLIERSTDGQWSVSFISSGKTPITSVGTDKELFSPGWFGILYKYSSTKDRLLWLDDIKIEGDFHEDIDAPVITGFNITGKNSLTLLFNEPPEDSTLITDNFFVKTIGNKPVQIIEINPVSYNFIFSEKFNNKTANELNINKICDIYKNCSQNVNVDFTPVWAEPGNVIITEIMADPSPSVSLPDKEYLEIKNVSDFPFNLDKWKLSTGEQEYTLPGKVIKPDEILILCPATDTVIFSKYGKTAGMKQFPLLTDAGRLICLSDSDGQLIHGVEYSQEWFSDGLKRNGGWSLEIMDEDMQFFGTGNWKASTSFYGGTPGWANSVSGKNPDNFFRGIENVFPVDSFYLDVIFSEPVLIEALIEKLKISENDISEIHSTDLLQRKFRLTLANPLIKGKVYEFEAQEDVTDFAGNKIEKKSFAFGMPEIAEAGDILFNELLFNPFPGDPDYIEFYNSSGKIIDASRLQVVSISGSDKDTSRLYGISDGIRCIMPGSYYAVTTGKQNIADRYPGSDPEHIFEVRDMTSMSDKDGHLILYNRELVKIDEVYYNEKMHYSLLSSFEGIALEKTSPDSKSGIAANWHSASESSGWGTPGKQNSMYIELPSNDNIVTFSSSKISPDGDGYEDFLTINFNFRETDNSFSITIFDEAGNVVKKPAVNIHSGPEAVILWDGTADDGSPLRTGIYIVYITAFNNKGKTESWKKVCPVLRK